MGMIIGLCGFVGSGKGAVAEYLRSQGWSYYSTTDVLKEELAKNDMPVNRESLINMANSMRSEQGTGVLVQRILKRLPTGVNAVIESLRNPDEVKALSEREGFILIAVDAPVEVRLRRILKRGRAGDPLTAEQLRLLDEREALDSSKSGIRIKECMGMADALIINDDSLEVLGSRVQDVVQRVK